MHVRRYQTEAGVDVFGIFMAKLKDHVGRTAIVPVDTILLLRAGDKSTQGSDIPAAITALQDWQRRHP